MSSTVRQDFALTQFDGKGSSHSFRNLNGDMRERFELILTTNDLVSPASAITRRYKDRWGIELFFKWIKQPLKIKSFLGRNENSVYIQILTALITYLLLALYRKAQSYTGSLRILPAEVRATLFQRPSVEAERYRRRKDAMTELAARQGGLFA